MATERINIEITETGARRVKGGIEDIGTAATGSQRALTLLKNALGALGLAAFIKGLINTADAYTNMQNQLKLVTNSTAQLGLVTDELLGIANRTQSSLQATSQIYVKVARNADALGMSQNEVLGFTESLNQAISLSGSSSQEAEAGLRQLAQAMGSGSLRGDELNSILENTSEVATVIAKGMGVTIGELRKMGAAGKITSQEIVKAFAEAREELAERFGKTVPTVSQALQVAGNQWTVFIGKLDTSRGITAAIAQGIIYLATNIDTLARAAAALGLVMIVVLAQRAFPMVIMQVRLLTAALLANPFAALAVAILAVVSLLITFSDQIAISTDGLVTLADVGVAAWKRIKVGLAIARDFVRDTFNKFMDWASSTFGFMAVDFLSFPRGVARGIDTMMRMFMAFGESITGLMTAVWGNMSAMLTGSGRSMENLGTAMADGFRKGFAMVAHTGPVESMLDGLISDATMIANSRIEREAMEADAKDKARKDMDSHGSAAPKSVKEPKVSFEKLLAEMAREGELLTYNRMEREKMANILQFESQLKRTLEPLEVQALASLTEEVDLLRQRSEVLERIGGPAEQYVEQVAALNEVMREAPQLTELLNQELAELEIQFLSMQQGGTFIDGYARQMRVMQLETRNAVADMGASFATIFGPGGSLSQGIGDAIAQSVVFGDRFDQAMKKVAQSVVANVISSLVQLGINLALNAALGNSLSTAATGVSIAQAAATAAAWTPAATLVNAATFGAGAAAGSAAVATSLATIKAMSVATGFAAGGYTGNGGMGNVAGVVHGQEYVLNARATRRLGRDNLDHLNAGGNVGGGGMNVTVVNRDIPGAEFEVNQLSRGDVEIIAKRIVASDAPNVIAGDLGNPSSRTRRSLHQNTTASAKRT